MNSYHYTHDRYRTGCRQVIVLLVIVLLVLIGGAQGQVKPYRHQMFTIIDFAADPWNNNYPKVTALRIIQDTLTDVTYTVGTKTITEKKRVRDSFYWIFLWDTVRTKENLPVLDTLGKAKLDWRPVLVLKKYVIKDYNIDLDQRFPRVKQ